MQSYGFTIKCNLKSIEPNNETYKNILKEWAKVGTIRACYYECDNSNRARLHCHGVIELPKGFYRRRLDIGKGYHWKLKPITDLTGWMHYIRKDVELMNYINVTYSHDNICTNCACDTIIQDIIEEYIDYVDPQEKEITTNLFEYVKTIKKA